MGVYLGSKKKKLYLSKILYAPVYEIGFSKWPDDLDTALEFVSAEPFTLSVTSPGWDGEMQYCNGKGWQPWDGSEISSRKSESGQCIYIRGTGNTIVSGRWNDGFVLTGTNIECNGNIENLLDYESVAAGIHPTMASYCYCGMFYDCFGLTTAPTLPATTLALSCYESMFQGCVSLTTAPALPATTLAPSCYESMFYDCFGLTTAPTLPATTLAESCYRDMFTGASLITIPSLPATTLVDRCYYRMFYGCSGIKLSISQTGEYTKVYCIPISGRAFGPASNPVTEMFMYTGGTFTGTPQINTTYYLDESNIIV